VTNRSDVAIQVNAAPDQVAAVRRLREAVQTPVTILSHAVQAGSPIALCRLHGNDHEAIAQALQTLLNDLDAMQVEYALLVGGEAVSRSYLSNILQRYKDIGYEQAMLAELESGHPSEEALKWHRRQGGENHGDA
jgi:hypothetical protein